MYHGRCFNSIFCRPIFIVPILIFGIFPHYVFLRLYHQNMTRWALVCRPLIYQTQVNIYLCTDLPLVVPITNSEVRHCSKNGHEGLDCIAVDHGSILLVVFRRKSTLVDNSETKLKLFNYCWTRCRKLKTIFLEVYSQVMA